MIKRKVKPRTKVRRHKNPKESTAKIAKEILKYADDYEYLSEGIESEIFYFKVSDPLYIKGVSLEPGEYVLKIPNKLFKESNLKYYLRLSNLNLIPKIYVFSKNYIIMKYINGDTLDKVIDRLSKSSRHLIFEDLKKSIIKWHSFKIGHGDLKMCNILIVNNKVHIIDPIVNFGDYLNNKYLMKNDVYDLKFIKSELEKFYD